MLWTHSVDRLMAVAAGSVDPTQRKSRYRICGLPPHRGTLEGCRKDPRRVLGPRPQRPQSDPFPVSPRVARDDFTWEQGRARGGRGAPDWSHAMIDHTKRFATFGPYWRSRFSGWGVAPGRRKLRKEGPDPPLGGSGRSGEVPGRACPRAFALALPVTTRRTSIQFQFASGGQGHCSRPWE